MNAGTFSGLIHRKIGHYALPRRMAAPSNRYEHADDGLVRTTCKVKVGEFNPKYTILSVYHAGDHYKIMVRLGFER